MTDNNVESIDFVQAARNSARQVAIWTSLVMILIVTLGAIIEGRVVISGLIKEAWSLLMWSFSFGGEFWGAIGLGFCALSLAAWVALVLPKCSEEHRKLAVIALAMFSTMWLLTSIGVNTTFADMTDLNGYQKVAILALYAPAFIAPALALTLITLSLPFGVASFIPLVVMIFIAITFISNLFA